MHAKTPIFLAIITVVVLVSAAPAFAKGPDQATISGPGLARPIVVSGFGEPGSTDKLGELADGSGLFLAMFGPGNSAGQRLATDAPTSTLGPKYDLTYRVPDGTSTGGLVRQDLYPDAAGGPVTYTAAGQAVFGTRTNGGWYRAPAAFGSLLSAIGVPASNATPQQSPSTMSNAAGRSVTTPANDTPWLPIAIASLLAVSTLVATLLWLARRHAVAQRSVG
jgi:hypothetical protein